MACSRTYAGLWRTALRGEYRRDLVQSLQWVEGHLTDKLKPGELAARPFIEQWQAWGQCSGR